MHVLKVILSHSVKIGPLSFTCTENTRVAEARYAKPVIWFVIEGEIGLVSASATGLETGAAEA